MVTWPRTNNTASYSGLLKAMLKMKGPNKNTGYLSLVVHRIRDSGTAPVFVELRPVDRSADAAGDRVLLRQGGRRRRQGRGRRLDQLRRLSQRFHWDDPRRARRGRRPSSLLLPSAAF